jgi:hypothetical protein
MVKEQYLTFKCQFLFTPSSPYGLIPITMSQVYWKVGQNLYKNNVVDKKTLKG